MEIMVPVLIVLAFAVLIFLGFYFSKTAIIKRQLKKAPVKSISQFRDGETARIIGKAVVAGKPLTAPLSGRECCHYHVVIEQQVQQGKNQRWKTIIDEEVSADYVIENNGYYAFINCDSTMNHIVKDRKFSSGFLNDASPGLEAYLKKFGHESEGWLGLNKTLRYHEGIIENGETIAILGKGEWKDAETVSLPAHYGRILCITPNEEKKFVFLSDDEEAVAGT